jgi:hypothetical protein
MLCSDVGITTDAGLQPFASEQFNHSLFVRIPVIPDANPGIVHHPVWVTEPWQAQGVPSWALGTLYPCAVPQVIKP